ncbi:hypothetical protein CBE01nite_20910 [Clostridium beijerinckii]|uniref:CLI_3235 family bacteriocin n=1 Tax=Clostridium beijerinckii TaxID=1520 RepID=A0AB74VH10_CLOBE|nr:CLI_3235 family bacteriocin precursor [Clostridium beijerinckii]NRZ24763.1 putative bacteriocin precursor [Clostridium beijerinckii]NYB99023.1 putative bacteriocin precursor [Clostridium beijerinckii]OOM19806.1 hypothetical protein CLBEI_48070 [Clostridium beijerinckii]QUN35570.1 CLI_3235 family bacteriocin precursor [Clostridium beijerinckii]SQB22071.1 putative bacteriocin precursor, CLI_3235 family [Clostridium beijerinckii]
MRKLGKKNYEIIETVEAYEDDCYAQQDCYKSCKDRVARKSLNDKLFNEAHYGDGGFHW